METENGGKDPPAEEKGTDKDCNNKRDVENEEGEWSSCLEKNKKAQQQIERMVRAMKKLASNKEMVTTVKTIATAVVKATLARFNEETMDEVLTTLAVVVTNGPMNQGGQHAGATTSTASAPTAEHTVNGKPSYKSVMLTGAQQHKAKSKQQKQQTGDGTAQRQKGEQLKTPWYNRTLVVTTPKPTTIAEVDHVMLKYGKTDKVSRVRYGPCAGRKMLATFMTRQQALTAYREVKGRMLEWKVTWASPPREALLNLGIQVLEGDRPYITSWQLKTALRKLDSGIVHARFYKTDQASVVVDPAHKKRIWDDLRKRDTIIVGGYKCRIIVFGTAGSVWKNSKATGTTTTEQSNNHTQKSSKATDTTTTEQSNNQQNDQQSDQQHNKPEGDKPENDSKAQQPTEVMPDDNPFAALSEPEENPDLENDNTPEQKVEEQEENPDLEDNNDPDQERMDKAQKKNNKKTSNIRTDGLGPILEGGRPRRLRSLQ